MKKTDETITPDRTEKKASASGKKRERAAQEDREAFRSFYAETYARLEGKMNAYNRAFLKEKNSILRPFRRDITDLNDGGKMLRGVLVNLGFRAAGKRSGSDSDGLSLALELFQTGVLIHDDIIDRASLRRGKKTIHTRYAESLAERQIHPVSSGDSGGSVAASAALCAGDIMLYEANLMVAESYAKDPNLGAILAEYDRIVIDTVRGELLDVVLPYEAQDGEKNFSLEKSILDIYHLKTSLYSVIGPLRLGMMLGGASEEERKAVDSFADDLGIAFQIKDDLLGIFSETESLGKDIGSDISEFKQTILYAFVKDHDPEAYRELMKYYGKARVAKKDLEAVRGIFTDSGARAYAEKKMETLFLRARGKIAAADFIGDEEKKILRGFIDYLGARLK